MVKIQSKRCKDLYSEIVQLLFKIELNINIDKLTALTFIHLGLPSKVLKYYQRKKKKNEDIALTIALMRIDSLRKLTNLKQEYKIKIKKMPLRYLYLKLIKSPRTYKSLKNSIIKKSKELKEKYIQEKNFRNKNLAEINEKINNFNVTTMINSIKSINDEIYKIAEVNPKKAIQISKMVNENLAEIEKLFTKRRNEQQKSI